MSAKCINIRVRYRYEHATNDKIYKKNVYRHKPVLAKADARIRRRLFILTT